MGPWLRVALPAIVALQALASGGDAARAATKVSFGQVSPTATTWPGIVATRKGFVEGEELPGKPQGDIGRYLDDTMLAGR
jgi:hypothetical protein